MPLADVAARRTTHAHPEKPPLRQANPIPLIGGGPRQLAAGLMEAASCRLLKHLPGYGLGEVGTSHP